MSISIKEDIKSVSELKLQTREIFEQMHRTGRPIIVTVNGKPDAVLMDVEKFESMIKSLNLGLLLAEAELDVKKKQVRPARAFLAELKRHANLSR